MKTPRKILLEQHRAAGPKLDAIRQSVAAAVCGHPITTGTALGQQSQTVATVICQTVWRELIWPCRRIWTGLAAVWLLILAVNFSMRDVVSSVTGQPVHSRVVMISWQTQQRWTNELLADRSAPPEADHPRKAVPGPRTENFAPATV